jgi:prepilin-type N-terminal cleavage/methylation domain-containing protein
MVMARQARQGGFTLVELLVVLGLICLTLGIILPAARMLSQQAWHVTERNSARQAAVAWTNYAFENNGQLMPGYKSGLPASTADGTPIDSQTIGVAANRYPWRLAPQLGHNFDVLYVNEQKPVLSELHNLDDSDYLYLVATYPSLGLNTTWMGGDEIDGCFSPSVQELLGKFYSDRLSTIHNPDRLIVFASARGLDGIEGMGGEIIEGYFKVSSPNFASRRWAEAYDENDPASAGNVSIRGDGKSVVSRVDGAVDALSIEELDDMRLWADRADAPDWVLAPPGP